MAGAFLRLLFFGDRPGKLAEWIPHLADNDSGVGGQVVIADMNDDLRNDVVIANKKGCFCI
jgi:hypothetical protein